MLENNSLSPIFVNLVLKIGLLMWNKSLDYKKFFIFENNWFTLALNEKEEFNTEYKN